MALLASTNIQRLYVEGVGTRFALYRIVHASSADSFDVSTGFLKIDQALMLQTAFTNPQVAAGTFAGTTYTFAGTVGLSSVADIYVLLMGQAP